MTTDAAVSRLVKYGDAAVPMAMLPKALGVSESEAVAVLAELLGAGDAVLWPESPGGPAVVVGAEAARRAGVELDADGLWVARGRADHAVQRAKGGRVKTESSFTGPAGFAALDLDEIPAEPEPGFEFAPTMTAKEEKNAYLARRVPKPRILLGLALAWPVERPAGSPCPACHDRPLADTEACLICHRMGVDRMLPKVGRLKRARPYVPGVPGGTGKAKGGRMVPTKVVRSGSRRTTESVKVVA